jgi:molybdopterin/thiamine biosynthesis adenylyltransferase
VKFETKSAVKIVLLGAGGTGAHIAPHLYRLLYASDRKARVVVVDGDAVEEKNLVRQNFSFADIGQNKARAIATRYASAFKMEAEFIPEFIETTERLRELVTPEEIRPYGEPPETVILIGAVDNNESRKLCDRVFCTVKNLIYIDSGNGEYSGQVICGVRRNGRTLSKPIGALYPDVFTVKDKFPSELSCAESSVSAPQAITANVTAAAIVVDILYNIVILGECQALRTTFSTRTVNVKSELRKTRRKTTR